MNKIASPQDLQVELRRIMARCQEPGISRAAIAGELRELSLRVGAAPQVIRTPQEALKAIYALPKNPRVKWAVLANKELLDQLGIEGHLSSGQPINVQGYTFESSGVGNVKNEAGEYESYLHLEFTGWRD